MNENPRIENGWAWALLENYGTADDPNWRVDVTSVYRTRREVIAHALQHYMMMSDADLTWAQAKKKYRWRVEHVEITPYLFGKAL